MQGFWGQPYILNRMNPARIKKVRAPIRLDFAGGTTDIEPFASKEGGIVLNAGIDRHIIGKLTRESDFVKLEYEGNIPTGSGLGTSGVMNVVWLALVNRTRDKQEIVDMVYPIEQTMGITGGKQDQYAATFGGINLIEFKGGKTKLTRLKLPKKTISKLEKNLVLVYTGKSHFSADANKSMIDNLKNNKQYMINIRNVAKKMKNALVKGDLDKFAELMNEETENRKMLHKNIVNKKLADVIKKGKDAGAVSAKVCGAGGGGCILFYTENRKKLEKIFGKSVIKFKFDFEGLRWL